MKQPVPIVNSFVVKEFFEYIEFGLEFFIQVSILSSEGIPRKFHSISVCEDSYYLGFADAFSLTCSFLNISCSVDTVSSHSFKCSSLRIIDFLKLI